MVLDVCSGWKQRLMGRDAEPTRNRQDTTNQTNQAALTPLGGRSQNRPSSASTPTTAIIMTKPSLTHTHTHTHTDIDTHTYTHTLTHPIYQLSHHSIPDLCLSISGTVLPIPHNPQRILKPTMLCRSEEHTSELQSH